MQFLNSGHKLRQIQSESVCWAELPREITAVVCGYAHVRFQWDAGSAEAPRFLERVALKGSASLSSSYCWIYPTFTVYHSFMFAAFELHSSGDVENIYWAIRNYSHPTFLKNTRSYDFYLNVFE